MLADWSLLVVGNRLSTLFRKNNHMAKSHAGAVNKLIRMIHANILCPSLPLYDYYTIPKSEGKDTSVKNL